MYGFFSEVGGMQGQKQAGRAPLSPSGHPLRKPAVLICHDVLLVFRYAETLAGG